MKRFIIFLLATLPSTILAQEVIPGGSYIEVDLYENVVSFVHDDRLIWSTPAGTGTGLTLEAAENAWDFATPEGVYHVMYKEMNPVWIRPDWWYVQRNLPIPSPDSPSRRAPGDLGSAAIYLGADLAIHGTDRPELLGRRVSHGCIRVSNEAAIRLYHIVQTGTPVVIVGTPRQPSPLSNQTTAPGTGPSTEHDPIGTEHR
jgi:L,D-transpeptidase ErfK/SrfK